MIEDYFDMRDVEEQQRRRKERREELIQALYAKERLEKELICKIDLEKDKELINEYILSNLKVRKNCGVKQKKIFFYNYFYNNGNYLRETPFNYNLIRKEEMNIKKSKEKPQVREVRRYKSQKYGKCAHCESEKTPLWRNLIDLIVCNACWLYYKAHGVRRPSKLNEKGVVRRMKKKFQENTKK